MRRATSKSRTNAAVGRWESRGKVIRPIVSSRFRRVRTQRRETGEGG